MIVFQFGRKNKLASKNGIKNGAIYFFEKITITVYTKNKQTQQKI